MLVSCSSCNSKYLVNSADLKPDGRNVQCAKCGHNWFQISNMDNEEASSSTIPLSEKNYKNNNLRNLPSTYVKEKKPSLLNSILVITILIIVFLIYWFLKNTGINFLVLIGFYLHEFYYNLNMIINDLTKIIRQLLN